MTFAKSNQFQQAPRASAPEHQPSARDALEECCLSLQEETLDYFEHLDGYNKLSGFDMTRLISEAIKYDAGVKERQRAAKRAKAAKRLVKILTGAMTRAMMQGDTDLAEDLAAAVRRNVTVWADAYHDSY